MKLTQRPETKYFVLGLLAIVFGALDPIDIWPRLPYLALALVGTGVVVVTAYVFSRRPVRTPMPETATG
ncbi:MAG: hypothetical protein KGJ23_08640 [Euryarchaeota archaeon]|nr:hypothetical protein [Euryarchaeota archaeon]MDE1836670.1 hypothetical protein [Euryarchaeota archaeon]MDE1880301.1 hypothetical protein [Euryarchaeota archaeon]MDE2044640.1 hypothetical protein [Thermoplasmata archaeon]